MKIIYNETFNHFSPVQYTMQPYKTNMLSGVHNCCFLTTFEPPH